MILYLIRHGRTEANERHLYCGSTDLPLSCEGRKKLSGVTYPKAERYYTSGMKRTNETCEILYPQTEYAEVPGLREIDFGDFEMKSYNDLKDSEAYQQWLTGDNEENVCPHGESGKQANSRAWNALQILLQKETDLVVVSHGGIIAGMMERWFPNEGKNRYEWQPKPGKGYGIVIKDKIAESYFAL